jgi:hypothetical protein
MNLNRHRSFTVVNTIEGIEKGAESKTSAPPRLPDPQNVTVLSTNLKKHVATPLRNPFSFCSNSDISQSSDKPKSNTKKTIAFSLPNPFQFCSNRHLSSQYAYVPIPQKPSERLPISHLDSSAPIPTSIPVAATSNSHANRRLYPPIQGIQNSQIPRKPTTGREISHNALRPRIAAADRLFAWRTPHGISHDNALLEQLPEQLVESAKLSIRGALAPSTRSTYAAGILRFNQFCDRWSIPETDRMPASYALLCAFIGEYKGAVSGKTIKTWLSGVRAFHLVNRGEWLGDDTWVKMARTSANKEGARYKRPLRAPVSIEHLLTLLRALDISTPLHAAVWAVATTTFFGCRRLGETTVTSISSFDDKHHVLRSAQYAIP